MLSNLKISYRLAVGFGIALLGLTSISYIGLNSLESFNREVDVLVHDRIPKTVWANDILDQININNIVIRNIILTEDESIVNVELQRFTNVGEVISARIDSLERTVNSTEGKMLINKIKEKREKYLQLRQEYLNRLSVGERDIALGMIFGPLKQSQEEYMNSVYAIIDYQHEQVQEASSSVDNTYKSSITLIYTIVVVVFLFVIAASILITRSITSPVNKVKERLNQLEAACLSSLVNGLNLLSKGDLSTHVEKLTKHLNFTQKDEIGEMARVFDSMLTKAHGGIDAYEITRSKINQLSDELGRLIEDSKNGLLDNRGDDKKFEGVYRQLIAGLNQTLDAVIIPVQEGSRVLEVMSTGDFTPRINADYKGQHAVIKNSINKLGDSVTRILKDVTDAVAATASAGTQISSSSEELAAGSEEQSAQTTEIAGAIEQMTTTILQTTRNASTAAEQAKKAGDAAIDGGSVIKETIQGMNRIADVVKNAALTVKELGASSEQIGTIVQVIDDIADQTNLLALNAAIEAARAGEQGRGFAVVADEVRKLAERTTKATKEIGEMIKKIQKETGGAVASMELGTQEVEKGITLAEKSGKSLNEIITNASSVVDVINQVAAASEEQSSAAEQISKSIEGISSVTEQSTAGVQQIAKAAADLNSLTINLQNLVEQFKIEEDSFGRSRLAVRSNGVLVKH